MVRTAVLYSAVLFGPLSGSAVITLLQTFSVTYGVSLSVASLVIPFYTFPFAFCQLFSGAIADAFSKKKALVWGLGLFGLSCLLIGYSQNIETVLVARFFMGVFGSFQIPIVIGIVGEASDENRGRAFGILSVFINVGLAMGPFVAGLTDVLSSWQIFFQVIGFLALVNTVVVYLTLDYPDPDHGTSSKLDRFGLTAQFIVTALRNRQVWLLAVAGMFAFAGLVSAYIFLPTYLRDLNFTQDVAGLTVSMAGLVGMVFGPASGRAVDKFGRKIPLVVGFGIGIVTAILFGLFLDSSAPVWLAFVLMGMIGLGNSFSQAANNTISAEVIPELKATVASISSSFRFIAFAGLSFLMPFYIAFGFGAIMFLSVCSMALGILLFLPLNTRPGVPRVVSGMEEI